MPNAPSKMIRFIRLYARAKQELRARREELSRLKETIKKQERLTLEAREEETMRRRAWLYRLTGGILGTPPPPRVGPDAALEVQEADRRLALKYYEGVSERLSGYAGKTFYPDMAAAWALMPDRSAIEDAGPTELARLKIRVVEASEKEGELLGRAVERRKRAIYDHVLDYLYQGEPLATREAPPAKLRRDVLARLRVAEAWETYAGDTLLAEAITDLESALRHIDEARGPSRPLNGRAGDTEEGAPDDNAQDTHRTVKIGRALIEESQDASDFHGSKTEFKKWAGEVIGRSPSTAYKALQATGCYVEGRQGSSDGLQETIEATKEFAEDL